MDSQLSNVRIIGVAVALFCSILLGVGIHHVISTGTCSSTGYSGRFGPVPYCPSGTGWWIAFVMVGIMGGVVGGIMSGAVSAIFACVFGGIGIGALSVLLDSGSGHTSKGFAGIFGGAFALVGLGALAAFLHGAISALRPSRSFSGTTMRGSQQASGAGAGFGGTSSSAARSGFGSGGSSAFGPAATTGFGAPTPQASATSAFGTPEKGDDPILGAYQQARQDAAGAPAPGAGPSAGTTSSPTTQRTASSGASPLDLLPGLQQARRGSAGAAVDDLEKLTQLHKSGALTDDEFAKAKARLLGEI